jgi:hypothetical protein
LLTKNTTSGLYTAAEQALPWKPVGAVGNQETLLYMHGFASGTACEIAAITLVGVGIVTKVSQSVKGILAASEAAQLAFTTVTNLQKSVGRTTRTFLQLARSEEGSVNIGAVVNYLKKTDVPGTSTKMLEPLDEAFYDKPQLVKQSLDILDDHWDEVTDEVRRTTRYKKWAANVADLKQTLGSTLTDKGLRSFSKLQGRLFTEGVDNADRYPELKRLFDVDSAQGRQELNKFLEEAEDVLDNPNSNIPGSDLPFSPNNGFLGTTTSRTFNVGETLDRYGAPGRWLATENSPRWARSLPASTSSEKFTYRVKKTFSKEYGRIAPWYGEPGGGMQIFLGENENVASFFAEYLEIVTN